MRNRKGTRKIAISRGLAAASCVAAILFLFLSIPSHAQQRHTPPTRHVRDAVVNGQARWLGALRPTQRLQLAIALPLRNQAELDDLLQQLYDPQSPSYHQWLSVEDFTGRFGPTQADYEAVVQFAEANGMTVTSTTPNQMLVDVTASVADINRTFRVTMGVYEHPTEDRTFYAPDREPSADLGVQLWHITGMDDFSPPRPKLRFAQPGEPMLHTFAGSGPGGGYLGSDMRKAYYGGTALTGAGQSIGLFGLNFNLSDVQLYYNNIGQSFNSSVVQTIAINGYNTSCGSCDDGEPVIDIVESLSMAPGVNSVIEYEAASDVDVFNRMATDNIAKQLSASVGWQPADSSSNEPIFKEFAAQGQNLFVSSGDSGAFSSSNPSYYPCDDPYITSVGGTDLSTNGAGGSWASESSWVGSSGGPTTNGFAIPSYQQLAGVINSSNGGSTTLRNMPDVSMEANTDNYFGGTSLSAPRWAGFLALVNQQAAINGKSSVGFLNPLLYSIGVGSSYNSDFHDITSGNNSNGSASHNAVVGYDLVTGGGQALRSSALPSTR